jgi:hypothetical protein
MIRASSFRVSAHLSNYRQPKMPTHAFSHLRRLAGVLYVVSQLVRCLRLCPDPHYSHGETLVPSHADGERLQLKL